LRNHVARRWKMKGRAWRAGEGTPGVMKCVTGRAPQPISGPKHPFEDTAGEFRIILGYRRIVREVLLSHRECHP